jgi:methylated-DNA-[protein]-cysteine S-methyltransferase
VAAVARLCDVPPLVRRRRDEGNDKRRKHAMNYVTTLDTPIGELLIETNETAITQILLPGKGQEIEEVAQQQKSQERKKPLVMKDAVGQLKEYFAGKRTEFDLPLELAGTDFQREVWLALGEIPYGKTISYAELASMVGRPAAFRAVGQANGSNPIPIVLPCHRVIASGGKLGGYGGGLDMKRQLLSLEGLGDDFS